MPGDDRHDLTPAEDTLARVLADAVLDDLLADVAGPCVVVRARDLMDQQQLAERLRAEGREVRVSAA